MRKSMNMVTGLFILIMLLSFSNSPVQAEAEDQGTETAEATIVEVGMPGPEGTSHALEVNVPDNSTLNGQLKDPGLAIDINYVSKGWIESNGYWYYYNNGTFLTGGVWRIDDVPYFFDDYGRLYFGWFSIQQLDENGNILEYWYYAQDNGVLKTGWFLYDNSWYYFDTYWCSAVCGWQKLGGSWYYFSEYDFTMYSDVVCSIDEKYYYFYESGVMAVNCWAKMSYYEGSLQYTNWYYATSNGSLATGWRKIGGKWYYFYPDFPVMNSDRVTRIDGKVYCFDSSGALMDRAGWVKNLSVTYNNRTFSHWYYSNEKGEAVAGWNKIGGVWYYFKPHLMQSSTLLKIDGQYEYFNRNGAWVKTTSTSNWRRSGSRMWYSKDDGTYAVGWLLLDGEYYYFDANGYMVTGWKQINGKWYYFDPEAPIMAWGGYVWINGKYYFFNDSGAMGTAGWIKWAYTTDQHPYTEWFYANSDGSLVMGWKHIGDVWYYFDPEMYSDGWYDINGTLYYFDASGAWTGQSSSKRTNGPIVQLMNKNHSGNKNIE